DSGKKTVRGRANKNYSPFVESVENFFDKHKVRHFIERADRLAGIGRFGILILGFDDGKPLHEPLEEGPHKLIYMSAYGEPAVKILNFVGDQSDPRYALPHMYSVDP